MTLRRFIQRSEATDGNQVKGLRPKGFFGWTAWSIGLITALNIGLGIAARGLAYWSTEKTKIQHQERIEMRLANVEKKADETEKILAELDTRFVPRKEIEERERRELDTYARVQHLERMTEDINTAVMQMYRQQALTRRP